MKELSWKPRRVGDKYCSPGCGAGCTLAAYQKAVNDAEKLAKKLGPDWKPYVHENMGWHHRAVHRKVDDCAVYPKCRDGLHWCSLHVGGQQIMAWEKDPRTAFNEARKKAREFAAAVNKDLEKLGP